MENRKLPSTAEVAKILGLTPERKKEIEKSVDRIVKEYGEALRMLGKE